ncbi:hypothetical protein [Thiolapillus sp.]|uniref:Uncharacterized protein n=1 Tax=Thiolapillus brandeum TaxID=1076588 RepID=A0A831RUM9_9GAMM|nr:hypothetical protein [Thiolapillus sp.]HEC06016.1 hypothetical protein [Thiolapillus brandeum]
MAKKKTPARKKQVTELSAAELYKLAQKREQEELQKSLEANKEKLIALRTKRRELVAKQKKELRKLDAEISRLSGKKTARKGRKAGTSVTEKVVAIIAKAGKISTTDLKAELKKKGVATGNLPQTLAYLKRQGRVVSPARTIYQVPK